jgi:hypothetical protein
MDLRKILGVRFFKLWFTHVILSSKYFFDKKILNVDELDLDVIQIMCNIFIPCKFQISIIQVVENFHLWLWLMQYFHNQWLVIINFFETLYLLLVLIFFQIHHCYQYLYFLVKYFASFWRNNTNQLKKFNLCF